MPITTSNQSGSRERRRIHLIPLLVSVGLIAWLLWRVPLQDLVDAFVHLDWTLVVVVTLVLVVVLFLWDGVCIWWLFADPNRPFAYSTALRARGCAYLFTILHFGLGQGLLVWMVAKAQKRSLVSAAGRCLIMAYVDAGVLLSLGFIGALLSNDPRTEGVAGFCGTALGGLVAATLIVLLLPRRAAEKLANTHWGAEVISAGLRWHRIVPLYLLRLIYFTLGMVHASTVLGLCGIRLDYTVILSVIPLTALVDGLPISISGLGTRETMLLAFLDPEQPAVLLACSLVWWVVVVVSRATLAMGLLWLPRTRALLAKKGSRGRESR